MTVPYPETHKLSDSQLCITRTYIISPECNEGLCFSYGDTKMSLVRPVVIWADADWFLPSRNRAYIIAPDLTTVPVPQYFCIRFLANLIVRAATKINKSEKT
jgi:hypothetical protein